MSKVKSGEDWWRFSKINNLHSSSLPSPAQPHPCTTSLKMPEAIDGKMLKVRKCDWWEGGRRWWWTRQKCQAASLQWIYKLDEQFTISRDTAAAPRAHNCKENIHSIQCSTTTKSVADWIDLKPILTKVCGELWHFLDWFRAFLFSSSGELLFLHVHGCSPSPPPAFLLKLTIYVWLLYRQSFLSMPTVVCVQLF